MKDAIIKKINNEISGEIDKESQVFYIMGELRKLLDRLRDVSNNDYKIIRFFSDWVVHTKKDRITRDIKEIMERIEREIPMDCKTSQSWRINAREHVKFIYMESLIEEMNILFSNQGIDDSLLIDEDKRLRFISLLVKILEDQPIIKPIANIEKFYFEPSKERCAIWIIEFNDERGLCRFGNMY